MGLGVELVMGVNMLLWKLRNKKELRRIAVTALINVCRRHRLFPFRVLSLFPRLPLLTSWSSELLLLRSSCFYIGYCNTVRS
jgi:hypothetical protein